MPKIQPFGDDLDAMRSVRFQWALHLFRQADACRHREDAQREAICSPADLEAFSVHVRQHVDEAIGGVPDLPEEVPYKVVREFVFDDVRTQLITFESFPGFVVPGLIYFAERDTPGPGIFIASGHFPDSKAHDDYQRLARELARNGCTVVIIDAMGLGERKSWLNPDGTVHLSGSREHRYLGVPCHLAGFNLARFIIHDARCAISLLASLPLVDAQCLGVTGHSGGGLLITYLAIFEPRLAAAAPVALLCDRYRHMHTTVGHDADFMAFGVMKASINCADFLAPLVPKPLLVGGVDSDFFPAEGYALEVQRLQQLFDVAGHPERFESILAPGRHAYPASIRDAVVRFFVHHLAPDTPTEAIRLRSNEKIPLQPVEELQFTRSGLLYAERPDVLRANDLNRLAFDALPRNPVPSDRYATLLAKRLGLAPTHLASEPLYVAQLNEASLPAGEVRYLSLTTEPGIELGGILLVPKQPNGFAHLYLGDCGANQVTAMETEALASLEAGNHLLFADVRGLGAVQADLVNARDRHDHYGTEHWFAAQSDLMAMSVIAQRTWDAMRWSLYLENKGFSLDRVEMYAEGRAGLAALFALVLRSRPRRFRWENPLPDWDDVIHQRDYPFPWFNESVAVFGIARHFTMRELITHVGGEVTRNNAHALDRG